MSFSSEVKEELSRQFHKSRHCQIAEISAILSFAGKLEEYQEGVRSLYRKHFSGTEIFYSDTGNISCPGKHCGAPQCLSSQKQDFCDNHAPTGRDPQGSLGGKMAE